MILNLIGIIIALYAFVNYKKAFFAYLIYQVFWFYGAPLFTIFGKTITAALGFNFFFFIVFFFQRRTLPFPKENCPIRIPLLCLAISALVTCFTGVAGFNAEFTRALSNIAQDIIIVWLIWEIVETEKDFKELFYMFSFIMLLAAVYGLFEYLTGNNFIFEIKNSITEISNYNTMNDATGLSRGYRLMSFFEHPIGAGMCFGLYSVVALYVIVNFKKVKYKNIIYATSMLCLLCMFLTKMRSAMLFTLILLLLVIDVKKYRFWGVALITSIGILIALPYLGDYTNLFLSIFSPKYSSGIKGSSLAMRLEQFSAVFMLMQQSPIGGLGELFKKYIVNQYTIAAFSYESVWLEQMAKHGWVGVIANATMLLYSTLIIPVKYKSKEIFILGVAFWLTYTITSIPSFRMHLYYLVFFYFIKTSDYYKNLCPARRKRLLLKI